ncbi:hypothetical protein H2248_011155 [Termitomyces sp. 'cryptogamus']|nr:hypothetical protein H2248_011155 [Termitomyces sp. 'cryptogamus']
MRLCTGQLFVGFTPQTNNKRAPLVEIHKSGLFFLYFKNLDVVRIRTMFLRCIMNFLKIFQFALPCATSRSHSRAGVFCLFPTTGFQNIPASEMVEDSEECWDWYMPQSFYPV